MKHAAITRTSAVAAVLLAAMSLPALAQERLYDGVPKIASVYTDGSGAIRLRYALGPDAAETVVADLACDRDRNPDIAVHVPQQIAFEWLGGNADQRGPVSAQLSLGNVQAQMTLSSLSYDFAARDWALEFAWQGNGDEGLKLLAGATELGVVTSDFQIYLSDAQGQTVSLNAFVEACMAMRAARTVCRVSSFSSPTSKASRRRAAGPLS